MKQRGDTYSLIRSRPLGLLMVACCVLQYFSVLCTTSLATNSADWTDAQMAKAMESGMPLHSRGAAHYDNKLVGDFMVGMSDCITERSKFECVPPIFRTVKLRNTAFAMIAKGSASVVRLMVNPRLRLPWPLFGLVAGDEAAVDRVVWLYNHRCMWDAFATRFFKRFKCRADFQGEACRMVLLCLSLVTLFSIQRIESRHYVFKRIMQIKSVSHHLAFKDGAAEFFLRLSRTMEFRGWPGRSAASKASKHSQGSGRKSKAKHRGAGRGWSGGACRSWFSTALKRQHTADNFRRKGRKEDRQLVFRRAHQQYAAMKAAKCDEYRKHQQRGRFGQRAYAHGGYAFTGRRVRRRSKA